MNLFVDTSDTNRDVEQLWFIDFFSVTTNYWFFSLLPQMPKAKVEKCAIYETT